LQGGCTAKNVETWLAAMLTTANQPRSCKMGYLVTKAVLTAFPDALDIATREVQHAAYFWQRRAALRIAKMSEAAWHIASGFLAHYHTLKNQRGLLDYEDLINLTAELLAKPNIAPWILYKLDGGIDHLLVDEAQDTSRIQWKLIDALASEFFAGESAVESHRTLFVVGDEKQSIYSFQGAEPAAFAEMKQHFATQIKAAEKHYEAVNLSLSFRSTEAVLQAVDAVFAHPETQKGVAITEQSIMHSANRKHAGKVEVWPLIQGEESDEREAYTIPDRSTIPQLPEKLLAEQMAETIQRWLTEKRILKGKNRPIHAGDIMVLVRRRGKFFNFLIAELKKRNIPLAGADRMNLSDHIAVQDMLALAQFLLLPEDNLNLACLLKSPLFGFSEEHLYQVCQPRPHKGSVWNELRNQTDPFFIAARTKLEHWLNKVDYLPPYEMLSLVLEAEGGRQQFASRMGEEVHDPLTELLALALDYEQLHQPSLQGFLHWFGQSKIEIKRDLEQSQQKVRILTVHGSKGLEAPIVFLPDTTTKPDEKERLIWNTDESLFFWNYSSPDAPEMVKTYRAHHNEKAMEEYRRLLYVAMTRAADELYIAGWQGKKDIPDSCWYRLAERGLRTIAATQNIEWQGEIHEMLVLENEDSSTSIPHAEAHKITAEMHQTPLPAWVKTAPANEPFPPRPLMPSRPEIAEPMTESPNLQPSNYQRGQAVHSLLEILPDMPESQRPTAAKMLLHRSWPEATEAEAAQVVTEVLAILSHPQFAPVFSAGSQAEVPLTAVITQEGISRILSGQIDRLCITPTEILVVDYKTNRTIPPLQENIPIYYRKQLEGYAAALQKIYPQHAIKTAILWTSAPLLMAIAL
jgi:ATP-dependent helicase/nuclease subunit A